MVRFSPPSDHFSPMPTSVGFLAFLFAALLVGVVGGDALVIRPISDEHRSVALDLLSPADGFFTSLEEAYEALRSFQVLGIKYSDDLNKRTCAFAAEKLRSSFSEVKDLSYALRVNNILGCPIDTSILDVIVKKLHAATKDSNSLLNIYYSVEGLLSIKNQGHEVVLPSADDVFHAIKSLSQSDGRWRYDTNNAESSTFAAGIAFEALAAVLSLADSEIDQSMIGIVRNDIVKLFDAMQSYDDGALYFDEKLVDFSEYKGPLTTSASIVRGVTALAAKIPGKLQVPGDKILGLAKFFLSIGIPGSQRDFFNQIEALSCLEKNSLSVPLILSLPASIFSLTSKEQLKVEVTTVFGSVAPPLSVNLVQVISGSEDIIDANPKELQFDHENGIHYLDVASLNIDVGKYSFIFEISLHDQEHADIYVTGGRNAVTTYFTGFIKVDKAEIGISESDTGTMVSTHKLDLSQDTLVSLSASHLQKLQLSFQLTSPLGRNFKPHQVLLKLKHETAVEHLFIVESSKRQFKIVLDFLGLLQRFYYLSGKYSIELTVGDAVMENSFLRNLGYIELELPAAPEKAQRPPEVVDPYAKFGPKKEISHIFRTPEKRPPKEVSLAFTGLTLLPFLGFLIGLVRLGANLNSFPRSAAPATFSFLFHAGIAAVLLLYALFWLKLDLFVTLKLLGVLGVFLLIVGHRALSYHSSASTKQKTA